MQSHLQTKSFAVYHGMIGSSRQARGQVLAVLFGLLLWLPFTDSVIATVLTLAWYGFAGGALLSKQNHSSEILQLGLLSPIAISK